MHTKNIAQTGLTARDRLDVTPHFKKQMLAKGFTGNQVSNALRDPDKVTPVTKYPGQRRYCGDGVAVIVEPVGTSTYRLVTIYLDGVVTPLRADQMGDRDALNSRRLARR